MATNSAIAGALQISFGGAAAVNRADDDSGRGDLDGCTAVCALYDGCSGDCAVGSHKAISAQFSVSSFQFSVFRKRIGKR